MEIINELLNSVFFGIGIGVITIFLFIALIIIGALITGIGFLIASIVSTPVMIIKNYIQKKKDEKKPIQVLYDNKKASFDTKRGLINFLHDKINISEKWMVINDILTIGDDKYIDDNFSKILSIFHKETKYNINIQINNSKI